MSFLQGLFGQPNVAKLEAKRDVPGLIKALAYNEDKTVRKAAAAALGRIGDARAVESLVAALKDGEWGVRSEVALALGQLGDACAVEPLTVALQDSDSDVRKAAALALGQLGDARSVEPLMVALEDETVYPAAAEALGKIGDTRAVEPLTAFLDNDYRDRRAAEALAKIGPPAVEPLVAALKSRKRKGREAGVEVLVQIGDARAVEALGAALYDYYDTVQMAAVKALEQIGDARAVEALVEGLKHAGASRRTAAAKALTRLGVPDDPDTRAWHAVAMQDWKAATALGPVAVSPLAAALEDSNVDVRKAAAEALTQLGVPDDPHTRARYAVVRQDWKAAVALGPVAVSPLSDAFLYYDLMVSQAANALGEIGDAHAVNVLAYGLKKDDAANRRKAAAEALVKIGQPAVEPLAAALKDSNVDVRKAAAEALVKIGQPAVESLAAALKDSNADIRKVGVEALGQIDDARAAKALAAALKDSNVDVRKAAATALTQLGVPDDPDTRAWHAAVRQDWKAATALGAAAVPPLAIAFKSNVDVATRQTIIEVLGMIGAPATETLTAILFQDSDLNKYGNQEIAHMAARALGKTEGAKAVDALILALYDKWEGVYYSAVAALHSAGDPRAVGPIIEYLESHPAPQGDALKYERRDYPLREPTRDVALEALQAITRQNYGKDVEAWRKWFDASGLPRFSHPGRNQAQSDSREKVVRDMRRIIGEYEQQLPIIRTLLTTLVEALETGKTSRGERVNRGEIPTVLDQLAQARRAEGQYKLAGALSSLTERVRSIESWPTKAPEEKSSVSPAAPMTVAAVATSATDVATATASEHVEEQTKFDVILKKVGENKINVIKAVRFLTNLSLKETLDLLESAPAPILTAVSKEVAAEAKAKIEAEGAKVEVK